MTSKSGSGSGGGSDSRGMHPNSATVEEALAQLDQSSDETPFYEYTVSEINQIANYLEYETRMDSSRWTMIDTANSQFDENDNIIEEEWVPIDFNSAIWGYFRDNAGYNYYGNDVPATLSLKTIMEDVLGREYRDSRGRSAKLRMLEDYGVNPEDFLDEFRDYYSYNFEDY